MGQDHKGRTKSATVSLPLLGIRSQRQGRSPNLFSNIACHMTLTSWGDTDNVGYVPHSDYRFRCATGAGQGEAAAQQSFIDAPFVLEHQWTTPFPRPGALPPVHIALREDDPTTIKRRRRSVGAPVHGHALRGLGCSKTKRLKHPGP